MFVNSWCGMTFAIVLSLLTFVYHTQVTFGLFENLFGPQPPCLSKKDSMLKNGFLQYNNLEQNVMIQYPSDWAKEEINGKYTSGESTLYSLATFQPDTSEGFKSTLELEINDISGYSGDLKSLKLIGLERKFSYPMVINVKSRVILERNLGFSMNLNSPY